MTKSIVVFGAGPGMGRAIAHRYAKEGYTVVLVARSPEPLAALADELTSAGATAHAVTADLSDTEAVPQLAERIRAVVGDPDTLYYGPTPSGAFTTPTIALTPQRLREGMPGALYTLVALVNEFLPAMIERQDGEILIANGASALQGMANLAGVGLAAQRNYLQALQAELADKGVRVGRLYIGAPIEGSAWHAKNEADKAAGKPVRISTPAVSATHLADLLWDLRGTGESEATYPENLFSR